MKAGQIQRCALCGEGVLKAGVPIFWVVTLTRMGLDRRAVEQVAGLELLVGDVALARVLGPDPDIATPLGEARTVVVCEGCAGQKTSIYEIGLEG